MPLTPRGIVRAICTVLIFMSCVQGHNNIDVLFIWCAYLLTDGLGERLFKNNWTKPIWENPLDPKEYKSN